MLHLDTGIRYYKISPPRHSEIIYRFVNQGRVYFVNKDNQIRMSSMTITQLNKLIEIGNYVTADKLFELKFVFEEI